MPRFSRIRTGVLEDLAEQLRFAPKPTVLRQVERGLRLVGEIAPGRMYAEGWVVRRLTGYRPEIAEPVELVGEALMGDLSALLERLSGSARLVIEDLPFATLGLRELRARWGVTARTLERYRRRGLIGLRVGPSPARQRLVFPLASVEGFESAHRALLERAARVSRIDDDTRRAIVRRAARYRAAGLSRGRAASRLAARLGRSPEAVRQVLLRHDRTARGGRSAGPLFEESGPLTTHQRRVIFRGWRWGIEPARLARRFERSTPTIHRVVNERRAELLRRLDLTGPIDPSFLAGVEGLLRAPAARGGLGPVLPPSAARLLIESAKDPPPAAKAERERCAAYHALRFEAARRIERLARAAPRAARLDEIEAMLRWVTMLKSALLRDQAGVIRRALEERIGSMAMRPSAAEYERWARRAVGAAAGAIDRHDPFKGGRLAAPVSLAVSQALAWLDQSVTGAALGAGAARRAQPRPVLLGEGALSGWSGKEDWRVGLSPWQSWLEPDGRWRGASAGVLPEKEARALELHFGWGGRAPLTPKEVRAELGLTEARLVRAMRQLGRSVRGAG